MHLDTPDWSKKLIEYFWKNTQPLEALLIIDNIGTIIEHKVSTQIKLEYDAEWIKQIANKVSIRFKAVDFSKELGGLAMTINVFEGRIMLVKGLTPQYTMILLIPYENDLKKTVNTLSDYVVES